MMATRLRWRARATTAAVCVVALFASTDIAAASRPPAPSMADYSLPYTYRIVNVNGFYEYTYEGPTPFVGEHYNRKTGERTLLCADLMKCWVRGKLRYTFSDGATRRAAHYLPSSWPRIRAAATVSLHESGVYRDRSGPQHCDIEESGVPLKVVVQLHAAGTRKRPMMNVDWLPTNVRSLFRSCATSHDPAVARAQLLFRLNELEDGIERGFRLKPFTQRKRVKVVLSGSARATVPLNDPKYFDNPPGTDSTGSNRWRLAFTVVRTG